MILITSVSLLFLSCKPETAISTSFIIKNNSTHLTELKVFRFETYFGNQIDTTFNIPSNSEIEIKYGGNVGDSEYNFPFGIDVDSIYIDFDAIQRIIYRRNESKIRSILEIENYSGGKIDDDYFRYAYSITDDDYDNAIEIK